MFTATAKGPNEHSEAIMFTDPGSDLDFVREEFAQKLKLPGRPITLNLRVVNSSYREFKTRVYTLSLIDRHMEEHVIEAVGMPSITDTNLPMDMSKFRNIFPEAPEEAFKRPSGKVDIMLGMPSRRLHAKTGTLRRGLRLDTSIFSCGLVLTGAGTSNKESEQQPEPGYRNHFISGAKADHKVGGSIFFLAYHGLCGGSQLYV